MSTRAASEVTDGLYVGRVVHKRLRPVAHALNYRVFSVHVDVDRLGHTARRLRLFSYNRFNIFAIYDRDHGDGSGRPIAAQARAVFDQAGLGADIAKITMLAYPRVLGYVFNPLTVYYGWSGQNALTALIYEVNNTFGQRKSYVVPIAAATPDSTAPLHSTAKSHYVSPFNTPTGQYTFHIVPPGVRVAVAVLLRQDGQPHLKAHFAGDHRPLTDARLAAQFFRTPFLTFKVIAGIHVEALRLWLKGLKLIRRPKVPAYTIALPKEERTTP